MFFDDPGRADSRVIGIACRGGRSRAASTGAEPQGRRPMAGLYFEEFEEGQVFEHAISRTVTETDNVLFSS
jgi:acyl dehydratase